MKKNMSSMLMIFFLFSTFPFIKSPNPIMFSEPGHHFDYNKGGADWSKVCQTGKTQSPIDIKHTNVQLDHQMKLELFFNDTLLETTINNLTTTFYSKGPFLSFIYTPSASNSSNSSSSSLSSASSFSPSSSPSSFLFSCSSFHFHAASEHMINGVHFDLEMHFVCHSEEEDGVIGVLGVGFVADDTKRTNPFFDVYDIEYNEEPLLFNIDTLLSPQIPPDPDFFHYMGSYTTPPCTEGVKWFLLKEPLAIRKSQLKKFTDNWSHNPNFAHGKGNNRIVQPVNGRVIKAKNVLSAQECGTGCFMLRAFFILLILGVFAVVIIKYNRKKITHERKAEESEMSNYQRINQ